MGFSGENFEAIIDLEKETEMEFIELRFFKGKGQWIYLPKKIKIFSSENGKIFTMESEQSSIETTSKIAAVKLPIRKKSRYLKIVVERFGIIPDGLRGGGHEAWLFVDEIVLN